MGPIPQYPPCLVWCPTSSKRVFVLLSCTVALTTSWLLREPGECQCCFKMISLSPIKRSTPSSCPTQNCYSVSLPAVICFTGFRLRLSRITLLLLTNAMYRNMTCKHRGFFCHFPAISELLLFIGNGKQGFQTPIKADSFVIDSFGPLGTLHQERGSCSIRYNDFCSLF